MPDNPWFRSTFVEPALHGGIGARLFLRVSDIGNSVVALIELPIYLPGESGRVWEPLVYWESHDAVPTGREDGAQRRKNGSSTYVAHGKVTPEEAASVLTALAEGGQEAALDALAGLHRKIFSAPAKQEG